MLTEIKYAFYKNSEYGIIKIGYENTFVTYIEKVDCVDCENEPNEFSDNVYRQIEEYFEGKRKEFDLKVKMKGTPFQKKVWDALKKIPYGETKTYKDIAEMINCPKGFRAVGMACHNNPVWICVPCHRVVGKNGSLVGYAGGVDMKSKLLNLEKRNSIIVVADS